MTKMVRYKSRKGTTKAMKTRGGFTTPVNKAFVKRAATRFVGQAKRDPVGTYMRMRVAGKQAHEAISKVAGELEKKTKTGVKVNGVTYAAYDSGENATESPGQKLPMSYSEGSSPIRRGGKVNDAYTLRLKHGRPSTKSLRSLSRLHGSTVKKILSTEAVTGGRELFTVNYGFQQKAWTTLGNFTANFVVNDLEPLYGLATMSQERNEKFKAYASVLNKYTTLKIANTSKYVTQTHKIHVVRGNETSVTIDKLWDGLVSPTAVQPAQVVSTIPTMYQYTDRPGITNSVRSCKVDPKCQFRDSSYFRLNYEIVKTFTRTLKPDDVLDIKITEEFGPGIDLATMNEINFRDSESLVGCFIIIESYGSDCEGYSRAVPTDRYIGTAPGQMQISSSKGVEYVNSNTTTIDSVTGEITLLNDIRVYKYDPFTLNVNTYRPNFDYDKIGDPADVTKDFVIPIMTDQAVQYSGAQL